MGGVHSLRRMLFALVAAWVAANAPARAAEPVISEIRFVFRDPATGIEERVDAPGPDWFAGKHALRVGEPFSRQTADEDLARFITEHRQLCLEVRAEPVPTGGVRVVYVFERRKQVWAVRIERRRGSPSVDTAKLLDTAVRLRRDQPVTAAAIRADRERILDELRNDGHCFATVEARTEPVKERPEFTTVVFEVDRGPKVQPTQITIAGNRAFSEQTLKGLMRTKEDRWFTSRRFVRKAFEEDIEDIRSHYRAAGWEDVEVIARPVLFDPERVVVSVAYRTEDGGGEIENIRVEGSRSVSANEIRRRFQREAGARFAREAFDEAVRWLDARYYEAGFRAEAGDRWIFHEPGRSSAAFLFGRARETVTVEITVARGVGIPVVQRISHSVSGPYMEAEISGLDSLRPGSPASEEAVLRHLFAIVGFYTQPGPRHNHALIEMDHKETPDGWAARLEFQKKSPNAAPVAAHLRIHINEGDLYMVESVSFEGVDPVLEAHIRDRIRMRKGSVFRIQDREADVRTVQMVLQEKGYADAKVAFERIARPGEKVFELKYVVEPGPLCYFDLVRPRGNDITRADVITREMPFQSGDRFDIRKIAEGVQNLKRRGYFDDIEWTTVDSRKEEPGKRYKDIYVQVREATPFPIYLGVGASSSRGVFGDLRYQDNNFDLADKPRSWNDFISGTAFRGGGQQLALILQPGSESSRAYIRWFEPWFQQRPVEVEVSGGYFSRDWDDYRVDQLGGEISVGKRFRPDVTAFGGARVHRVNVTDVDATAPPDVWDDRGTHSVLGVFAGLRHNTIDDPYFPTTGGQAEIRAELVGTPLFKAIKLTGEGRVYRTVREGPDGSRHVVSMWGDAGIIAGGEMPVFERFYGGGLGSVRGFATRGIGPRNKTIYASPPGGPEIPAPGHGDPIGGRLKLEGGVEYHIPILKDQARGIVFLDAGSVAENTFDVGRLISDLRLSAGVGAQFRLPFLGRTPVAVYVGFPIKKVSGDETEAFSFSVGLVLR